MESAPGVLIRDVPGQPRWRLVAVIALVGTVLTVAAREQSLREAGFRPALSMNRSLWARQRWLLSEAGPGQTVLLGSSRMVFGFDQEEWVSVSGGPRPFMLAWPGTCPRPQLHDLATDTQFRGTVLCGVTPSLFFASPDEPFPMRIEKIVRFSRQWRPAEWCEQVLRMRLEKRLLVMLTSDRSLLSRLRMSVVLPQRSGQLPLMRYIQFADLDEHCRVRMHESFPDDPERVKMVTDTWLGALERSSLYPLGDVEDVLGEVKTDIDAIRNRGGEVIFVRFPSTSVFRDIERTSQPRPTHWDRLLEVTGCRGIHFEDYPELAGFDCPEWSHLTNADAREFTRRLHRIFAVGRPSER